MIRTKGRRRLTCYHEAGHCLARWYFGHLLDRVLVLTVEEVRAGVKPVNRRGVPRECEGFVDAYDIENHLTPDMIEGLQPPEAREDVRHKTAISYEMALVECLAGIEAEARYTKQSSLSIAFSGGEGDMQHVTRILEAWFPKNEHHSAELLATDRTRALLRSHKGWQAVSDIAATLMERGELTGNEVAEICRSAYDGRKPTLGGWLDNWPPTLAMIRAGQFPLEQQSVMK